MNCYIYPPHPSWAGYMRNYLKLCSLKILKMHLKTHNMASFRLKLIISKLLMVKITQRNMKQCFLSSGISKNNEV